MTEKDFNRAILAELAKVAKDYFAELSIPSGTYTASELASGKKGKEKIKMSAPDEISRARHIIRVESFRCEFTSESVFSLLAKFEKLAGVGQKEKAHFVRMAEPEGVVCSFVADFGKGVKWAANHVANDDARPIMNCACLNVERAELVASDGHILSVANAPISELSGELPESAVMLNSEMIKNLKGKCLIRVTRGGIVAESESGKEYTHDYDFGRYPNYRNVIPDVSPELRATFTPESVKKVLALLKSARKTCDKFHVDINKCERIATIKPICYWNEIPSIQVELSECPESEIHTAFLVDAFARAKNWDGRIWFGASGSRVSVLGDKCAKLAVICPSGRVDELCHSFKPAHMIDAFGAVCGTPTPEPAQATTEPEKVPEKASETPNLPAPYVVADVAAVSFAESFAELMAFLFAFFFESETRMLLARLQYLADLAGKPMADLVPEPVATTAPEPTPEPASEPSSEPPERIVARTVFAARLGLSRARCRTFAPPGIRFTLRHFRTRIRGAKRIVTRSSLSPPRKPTATESNRVRDGTPACPSRSP